MGRQAYLMAFNLIGATPRSIVRNQIHYLWKGQCDAGLHAAMELTAGRSNAYMALCGCACHDGLNSASRGRREAAAPEWQRCSESGLRGEPAHVIHCGRAEKQDSGGSGWCWASCWPSRPATGCAASGGASTPVWWLQVRFRCPAPPPLSRPCRQLLRRTSRPCRQLLRRHPAACNRGNCQGASKLLALQKYCIKADLASVSPPRGAHYTSATAGAVLPESCITAGHLGLVTAVPRSHSVRHHDAASGLGQGGPQGH